MKLVPKFDIHISKSQILLTGKYFKFDMRTPMSTTKDEAANDEKAVLSNGLIFCQTVLWNNLQSYQTKVNFQQML